MKKNVIALVIVFVLSIAGSVFAAESPFADVPAGHWAYDALKQLSDAGIVEGYKDGVYRGQSTISRFEMAIIAGNAMTKVDKADAGQKGLIEKLAVEFAPEIKALGSFASAAPAAPAANKSGLRITGDMRESYERTKYADDDFYTRFRINMYKPLTDKLSFFSQVEYNNAAGTTSNANLTQAFLAGKAFGLDTVLIGRMPLVLGQGLLLDSEHTDMGRGGGDGIVLGGGNKLKVIAFAAKAGGTVEGMPPSPAFPFYLPGRLTAWGGNASYAVNDQLTLSLSHIEDVDQYIWDTSSAGLKYKASPDITILGEYGRNKAYLAKILNNDDSAKGWYAKVKYRGANKRKKNSYGAWVGYRNMDPAFDLVNLGSAGHTDVPHFLTRDGGVNGTSVTSDIRGFEYGFEQTLFENAILTLQYFDTKAKTSDMSVDSCMISLSYLF